MPIEIPVHTPSSSYSILLGPGLLEQAGGHLSPLLPSRRAVIVTEARVAPLFLAPLESSLRAAGLAVEAITVEAGEGSKSWDGLQHVTRQLLARKVDRKTAVVALGGGVIGDLAGFAAAITLRGLPFVQIPTTLLAQVDSSVGGKTGINAGGGKNLIGAFYQPLAVLMDTNALKSLPPRHGKAGYAEILKYGLLGDAAFFAWLEQHGAAVLALEDAPLMEAIAVSCRAKAAIVAMDERESGVRALLNLGHTFGHALEAETGFSEALHHGEAVAMGCLMAFALSVRLGLCPEEDYRRLSAHQRALGYPSALPQLLRRDWNPAALLAHMEGDKKTSGARKTFILARGIGQAFVSRDVEDRDVLAVLETFSQ